MPLSDQACRIAGRVVCGNSLSHETYSWAFTPAAAAFVAVHGHPFASQVAQQQAIDEAARKKAALIAKLEGQHMGRIACGLANGQEAMT